MTILAARRIFGIYHAVSIIIILAFLCISFDVASKRFLQLDEIIMFITMKRPLVEGIFQNQDYSAPLYQLILRLYIWGASPSELMLRLPALVAGSLCLLVSWLFLLKNANKSIALIFLLVISLNPFYLEITTIARPYSFYSLFLLLALFSLVELSKKYTKIFAFIFVGSTLCLIYSTYIGILIYVLLFLLVMALGLKNGNLKKTISVQVYCVLGAVPAILLAGRYVLEGAPALNGWIAKPSWRDFILGRRFQDFFGGDQFLCAVFFISFIICAAIFLHFLIVSADNCTTCLGNGNLIYAEFMRNSVFWLVVFSLIILIYYVLNAFSLFYPVYTTRYGFPVVILLCITFSLYVSSLPMFARVVIVSLVVVISAVNINYSIGKDYGYIVQAGNRLDGLSAKGFDTYLVDWTHCAYWVSPELVGLKYYGFNMQEVNFIRLVYGDLNPFVADDARLPSSRRGAILVVSAMNKYISDYLTRNEIAYKSEDYGPYRIFIY